MKTDKLTEEDFPQYQIGDTLWTYLDADFYDYDDQEEFPVISGVIENIRVTLNENSVYVDGNKETKINSDIQYMMGMDNNEYLTRNSGDVCENKLEVIKLAIKSHTEHKLRLQTKIDKIEPFIKLLQNEIDSFG